MAGRRASSSLDGHLRRWLSAIAKGWRMPVNAAARALGVREIANRTKWYPEIGSLLLRGNYTARDLRFLLRQCWALMYRYDAVHLSKFLDSGKAKSAIARLVANFPHSESRAASRVDSFVVRAT